jgi:hypothetical protein
MMIGVCCENVRIMSSISKKCIYQETSTGNLYKHIYLCNIDSYKEKQNQNASNDIIFWRSFEGKN